MKSYKALSFISIIFLFLQILFSNVYAESTNKEFQFEKLTYSLRCDHDCKLINLILPEGYTMKDVEITSENENIVHIFEIFDHYYMESLSTGETRLKATIPSTNYITYCNVKVEEPILINVLENNTGTTLSIDNYCPYMWSKDTKQACEISIASINNPQEEKWIRLGEDLYGIALNQKYSYDIAGNCIVSVRWVSWWDKTFFDGEHELYRKTIVINDKEPVFSIGAHIKIYANNYNETSSILPIENTLQLNTKIIEISDDSPITWKSYQENVAIVDANGVVTAIREGVARIEATVTDTVADGETVTYTDVYPVIVQDNAVITTQQLLTTNGATSGIIPDAVSVGNDKQAFLYGEGLTVSWNSSNNKIATVDENGVIKGIATGKTSISAKISYNNSTYEVIKEVNVTDDGNLENKKDSKNEINHKNKENNKLQDNTVAKQKLPQTGENNKIMILIGMFSIILIVLYKKYKNYKSIK